MNGITNAGVSAALLQSVQQNPPKELGPKEQARSSSLDKNEIKDTADLSSVSKNLNEKSGDGTTPPISPDDLAKSVESVRVFIANHKENALDQQANQSKTNSIVLIN